MFRMIPVDICLNSVSNVFCSSKNRNPSNCIDTSSTGVSFYDSFLDPKLKKYLKEQKNLVGQITNMTPLEYYEACASIFNSTVQSLQSQRRADTSSIDYLTNALKSRKFYLPYLNFATKGQEGLHRMMVLGDKYGWESTKFPVLVVDYADEHQEVIRTLQKLLNQAVQESLTYKYIESKLPEELLIQIQWELDTDEENRYKVVCIHDDTDVFVFSLEGYETEVSLDVAWDDIKFRGESSDDEDDFDIDEELLKMDADEFLKYL